VEKISVSKFKATCPEVLQRVHRTRKPVLVTRYGAPLAEITPPLASTRRRSWLGAMAGTGEILGDIVSPVTETDDWQGLEH